MWTGKNIQGVSGRVRGVLKSTSGVRAKHNNTNDTENSKTAQKSSEKPVKKSAEPMVTEHQMAKWRTHPDAWRSSLGIFASGSGNRGFLEMMAASPEKFLEIYRQGNENKERVAQQLIPLTHSAMGPDLAAANFLYHRGAAIKFARQENWMIKSNKQDKTVLPNRYTSGWVLERFDCEHMKNEGVRYEGLENFSNLRGLTWISLKGNKHIDDWGIDRLTAITYKTLKYLNIADCSVTYRGLIPLWKIESLKVLVLGSKESTKEVEIVCSMLEENNPNLLIKFV